MKTVASLLILGGLVQLCSARLGETETQLLARYGRPSLVNTNAGELGRTLYWISRQQSIAAWLSPKTGRCWSERVDRKKLGLDLEAAKRLRD
jgi:hypothetical protein